jgi:hypothetical protein
MAAHAVNSVSVFAALYVLKVNVAVVPLKRSVPRRVAILATRGNEHTIYL